MLLFYSQRCWPNKHTFSQEKAVLYTLAFLAAGLARLQLDVSPLLLLLLSHVCLQPWMRREYLRKLRMFYLPLPSHRMEVNIRESGLYCEYSTEISLKIDYTWIMKIVTLFYSLHWPHNIFTKKLNLHPWNQATRWCLSVSPIHPSTHFSSAAHLLGFEHPTYPAIPFTWKQLP